MDLAKFRTSELLAEFRNRIHSGEIDEQQIGGLLLDAVNYSNTTNAKRHKQCVDPIFIGSKIAAAIVYPLQSWEVKTQASQLNKWQLNQITDHIVANIKASRSNKGGCHACK